MDQTETKFENMILRAPVVDDLDTFTEYINILSAENTFTIYAGEKITREEENVFLNNLITEIDKKNTVAVGCFIKNTLIALAMVERNTESKSRRNHIGIFSISVRNEFRGKGIGSLIAKKVIEDSKQLPGIRLLQLNVYNPNKIAINLYKKLGFKEYGILPQGVLYRGEYIDDIHMYLTL